MLQLDFLTDYARSLYFNVILGLHFLVIESNARGCGVSI